MFAHEINTSAFDQEDPPGPAEMPHSGGQNLPVPAAVEPRPFFLSKLQSYDVILLGTKHDQPATTHFLMDILPILAGFGVTHVGLEITSDQQKRIDKFAATGAGRDDIEVFHVIDSPEYRCFLDVIRLCELKPVALDLPHHMWNTPFTRDEWMANNISSVMQRVPRAKILVVVGNLHTLKRVDWIDPAKQDRFLPEYLSACEPELDTLSVLADYEDVPSSCTIRKTYMAKEKPLVLEASGLNFKPKVLNILAAKPMQIHELTDAIMMY